MVIQEQFPLLERILARWPESVGGERAGYRNHVCRLLHFCFALRECSAPEKQKLIIAGAFHDLGIWIDDTFDYIPASVAAAQAYLRNTPESSWAPEIARIITEHHKITRYRGPNQPLVELFRRADLVDLSLGLVRFGIPRADVEQVIRAFPNAGFHAGLAKRAARWFLRHPLQPFPMLKW